MNDMVHPRNIEDSEKLIRRACVERLREAGVVVHKFRQNPQGIADAIRSIEPKFGRTTNPMSILRAYLGLQPTTPGVSAPVKPLRFTRAFQQIAERARACQPPMMSMCGLGDMRPSP
ncbi:hypothetical protein [Bordetella genomosp. 7]|uniref:Uncharacterized protein n=1 Tax=Bordetella genomosp. 7 TaxID=1416805 RepID=A0A261R0T0_9BORD|nr:hypothetical protein [Bordetella genomosp. 7]OZI17943.1 hypothetical protein CAL19_12745 [Bordetella genomosp. 7]